MLNYCGSDMEQFIPMNAGLVKHSGRYGIKNIFCAYRAVNSNPPKTLLLNFTRYVSDINARYSIQIIYNNGNVQTATITNKIYTMEISDATDIFFYYYAEDSQSSLPFVFNVDYVMDEEVNYLGLFISIGVVIFVCLSCSIIFYKCGKMLMESANKREQERLRLVELHAHTHHIQNNENNNNIAIHT
jgi:hypothetical protein